MNKVAQVTFAFWLMKISATTLGETAGDWLSMTLNIGYAASSALMLSLFAIALVAQLYSKTFRPWLYWTVIVTTSIAGTNMSDFMDRTLKLGYATGSAVIATTLVIILAIWRFTTGTLSVDKIDSRKAETFYWFAILVSNTLGTALGDYLADDSGLGFLGGAILVGSLIGLIAILFYTTKINRIFLFWVAFVLTRPFGATFGDVLTKPVDHGGLNLGTAGSSLVLLAILVALVVVDSRKKGPKAA